MPKKTKMTSNQIFSLGFVVALLFIAGLILWQGMFKKKPIEKKVAPPIVSPAPSQNSSQVFFASNGKNTVYKIKKGDRWSVIWNGKEGKEYDFVSNPAFSPDGTQLAYNAEINGQAYVVVNNTFEIYAYQKASYIVFSLNNQVIAFVATINNTSSAVISSQITAETIVSTTESQPVAQIGTATNSSGETSAIFLNDDGSQIAYVVQDGDQIYIIVNGEESETYDNITDFSFNDDGTYSYTATDGETTVTVINDVIVSTTSTTSTTTTTTTPTPTPTETTSASDDTNNVSDEGYVYPYKISTQKDIVRDPAETDSSTCPAGSTDCNF